MKHLLQQSRLQHLLRQRNGYLVLSILLLVISFLAIMLCFNLSHRERVVLVPPEIKHSFWVSNHDVSSEYLSEMTLFFAYLRLNVTPESADNQRQILLRYTDPRYFGILNHALIAERERMVTQHFTSAFYPVSISIDSKTFSVVVTGDLVLTVGTSPLPGERVSYQLQYRYIEGRLLVSRFQEVKAL